MRKRMSVLILLLAFAPAGRAAEHLVSPELKTQRLQDAAAARATDLAQIEALLATPAAVEAARHVGVDVNQVRAAAVTLSDGELRDLAERTRALQADPAAGLDSDVRQLLIIFLIVAIVILVLQAVD